ncbi:MAG: hypothetical protein ACFBSE_16520 [Prochloraceae cyanobacterium]
MDKNWPEIEKIFQEAGINYKQQQWFYRCQIDDKYFYYSPQTGKWKIKGKRAWKQTDSPENFIVLVFKYIAEEENLKERKNGLTNNDNNEFKILPNHFLQEQPRKKSNIDIIRTKFLDRFNKYFDEQKQYKYKIKWIWYKLIEEFIPTKQEICWLSVILNYPPSWAYNRIRFFYTPVIRKSIVNIIESNRDRWLKEFEKSSVNYKI